MDPLADLTFLKSFTGGDPEKMKKYINLFVNGAEPMLEGIRSSLDKADWPALRTAAHTLKSQVKYMGIKSAEDLAYTIEQHAGAQTALDTLPEATARLETVTRNACAELRSVLAGL